MEDRVELVMSKYKKGYNCSQSVFCAYSELLGFDEETAFRLAEGFGGGMGGMRDTCGAVTAIFMIASMLKSDGLLENSTSKQKTYASIKRLADEFKEIHGSIICRELLANSKTQGGRLPCAKKIEDAARLLEQYIESSNVGN